MEASSNTIHEGSILYDGFCSGCHGIAAVADALPDLRYASAVIHEQFQDIVLGGQREPLGMPSFSDVISSEQVKAIQAYILFRTNESSKSSAN